MALNALKCSHLASLDLKGSKYMQSQLGIYTLSHKRGNDMLDLVGFSEVAK